MKGTVDTQGTGGGLDQPTILEPGRNCFQIARAQRAAVLIDAAHYFACLQETMKRAQRTITIIGWDFDGRIKLCPDHNDCPALGPFLRSLVDASADLNIRILVWSGAVVHAPGDPIPLMLGAPWQDHPRIRLQLDHHHPLYASHHQKLVIIDDTIAFVGGIDLTIERWDTCAHSDTDPFRLKPDGDAYRPIHDVQMVVDGEAARVVAEVARERWRVATGEVLSGSESQSNLWCEDIKPDFTEIPVGIARTVPAWKRTAAVREIEALTADMFSAARQSIYIESQYFTANNVRRLLKKCLAAAHGPEIVLIVKRSSPGTLERFVMGANRDRVMRYIRRMDRHNRLRFYYPVVAGEGEACEILIHSKVAIIDDRILRVGSSNLNNRSMGLDTECDLVIEASKAEHRQTIAKLRDKLLAEHMGVSPEQIAQAVDERGSLIRGIEACNLNKRALRPFPETDIDGPTDLIPGTKMLDPKEPISLI